MSGNDDEFDRATNQNDINKEDSLNFESEEIQSQSDVNIIYSGRPAQDDEDAKKIANIVIVSKKTQSRESRKVNSQNPYSNAPSTNNNPGSNFSDGKFANNLGSGRTNDNIGSEMFQPLMSGKGPYENPSQDRNYYHPNASEGRFGGPNTFSGGVLPNINIKSAYDEDNLGEEIEMIESKKFKDFLEE